MLIAVTTSLFADDTVKPSTSDKPLSFAEETARAFKQVEEADFVAWYSMGGKLDIGVGRTDKDRNLHHPITFTLEELEDFFGDQKHKDLIVVGIMKHVWTDDELKKHVEKLRDFFVERGYAKIVIQQAHGSGRGIHLEHTSKPEAEQVGAGQLPTRTEFE